ncbi:MAG: glycosyl hydrolase-related protein [Promethearchaeia archaeon]
MKRDQNGVSSEDINALQKVISLVKQFSEKNPIRKYSTNFDKLENKVKELKPLSKTAKKSDQINKEFQKVLKKLKKIIGKEDFPPILFVIGAHGGVIVKDIPFCEFDSPEYAMQALCEKMRLALDTKIPYNLEVAPCCLEWVQKHQPNNISTFLDLFHTGKFEIINPAYAQPYSLLIGPESNIKQFEYGIQVLTKLGLKVNIYYCTESSLHPQLPQILKSFGIGYASLRVRLLGTNPTSPTGHIEWKGLDNTKIHTLTDQPGLYNGEYFHGTFFREIPNLLFQAVSRPILDHIVYSSIEDFVMPQPFQEEIWRINKYTTLFGDFCLSSDVFHKLEKDGTYKYARDAFFLGDKLFKLPNLLLHNKEAEISLISAEIFHALGQNFNITAEPDFFENLWRDLLLAQSHDAYAVPFIRTGDYSQFQLTEEELSKLDLKDSKISIAELSTQICKEIQKKCRRFVLSNLKGLDPQDEMKKSGGNKDQGIIIFNPSPYFRKEIVNIPLPTEYFSKKITTTKKKNIEWVKQGSKVKFIVDLPPFGFKFLQLEENEPKHGERQSEFKYEIKVSKSSQAIQFNYLNKHIFDIKFQNPGSIKIKAKKKTYNSIETRVLISGESQKRKEVFSMEIVQYSQINRLEFILNNISLEEILIEPLINIRKTLINYPFGIEQTRRDKIKTLDFLLLKGKASGLIFIQKNCPRFEIDHQNHQITNRIGKKGDFKFSISFLKDPTITNARKYVNCYYYSPFGTLTNFEKNLRQDEFLSIEDGCNFVNVWRRGKKTYLRLLNPSDKSADLKLNGKLVADQIEILNLNHHKIKEIDSKKLKLKPWEIKTLRIS